eukprot:351952-Chlamydomonas_euryale.AAC.15
MSVVGVTSLLGCVLRAGCTGASTPRMMCVPSHAHALCGGRLLEILEAIPQERILQYRRAAQKYYRAFYWCAVAACGGDVPASLSAMSVSRVF